MVENCLTECNDGYYLLSDGKCSLTCPSGYAGIDKTCEKCSSKCSTCSISVDHCDSCSSKYYLYNNQCVSSCPTNTIIIEKECLSCTSNCETCSSTVDHCETCVNGYYLYNNRCLSQCPSGTVIDGTKCSSCTSNCETCSSTSDHCETCVKGYYLYNNQCHSKCTDLNNEKEDIYFGNNDEKYECMKCSIKYCIDCSSEYSSCTKCIESHYFDKNLKECLPKLTPTNTLPVSPTTNPDDDNNCENNKRCHILGSGKAHSFVNITSSQFTNLEWPEDGGAIHFINYGIVCQRTNFINCSSYYGGGGIYIYVNSDLNEDILITKATFTQCKALYGGGIYAFSNIKTHKIIVKGCTFKNNSNIEPDPSRSNPPLFGGSAIFFTVKRCQIYKCKFISNSGKASVKLYNDFSDNQNQNSAMQLDDKSIQPSVFISNCHFETDSSSSCSFFYEQGKNQAVNVDLSDCVFIGQLSNGSYHIDGTTVQSKDKVPKLTIKSCKFSTDVSKSINMNSNNRNSQFASFDVNNQVFNYKELANSKVSRMKIFYLLSASLAFISIVIFVVILIKNKLSMLNDNNDNNDNNNELFEAFEINHSNAETLV